MFAKMTLMLSTVKTTLNYRKLAHQNPKTASKLINSHGESVEACRLVIYLQQKPKCCRILIYLNS